MPTDSISKAVIILAHGGSSNRSRMLSRAAFLVNGGYDVLAIDLRAHGGSEGELNTLGMNEALDMLGAADFIRISGNKKPIIFMGISLGSIASINAAAQFPEAAAVIAEGAFKSYHDALQATADYYLQDPDLPFFEWASNVIVGWPFVNFLSRLEVWYHTGVYLDPDKTNAIESVKKIQNTPILFITGENDFMKPEEHVLAMVQLCKHPLSEVKIIMGGGHSAFNEETGEIFSQTVLSFLDKVMADK